MRVGYGKALFTELYPNPHIAAETTTPQPLNHNTRNAHPEVRCKSSAYTQHSLMRVLNMYMNSACVVALILRLPGNGYQLFIIHN